jgi:2-amino-4-hydroxy-6-hydroxymethyldihydropteridine diphosphokinase
MILIALGANLPSCAGPPVATLRAALERLPREGITVRAISPYYRSNAWPDPNDPSFVNAVTLVETARNPAELLAQLKDIERAFGRGVGVRNAPRPLDLDILDYDGRIEAGPPELPHPRLHARGFVLVPLKDVAPGWRHPVSRLSIRQLIEALPPGARALTRLA